MDTPESVYDGIQEVNALVGQFEDIHICGACRAEFNNLDEFLHHKQRCKLLRRIKQAREQKRLKMLKKDAALYASQTGPGNSTTVGIMNSQSFQVKDTHPSHVTKYSTPVVQSPELDGGLKPFQEEAALGQEVSSNSEIHVEIVNSEPDYPDIIVFDSEQILDVDLQTDTLEKHSIHLDLPLEADLQPAVNEGQMIVNNISTCNKMYTCTHEDCSYSTNRPADLSRHTNAHFGTSSNPCPVCGKTFSRADALKRHERSHTKPTQYHCNQCSYATSDRSTLKRHVIRTHCEVQKLLVCSKCPSTFCDKTKLAIHERTHTDERPYSCQQCSKRFHSKSDLSRHERVHSGDKPYKCDQCSFSTKLKFNLTSHVRCVHTSTALKCDACDVTVYTKHDLKQHKLSHNTPIYQQCPHCQQYVRKSSLYIHMQLHDETRLECSLCDFRTKYRHCLTQHLTKIHQMVTKISKNERTLLPHCSADGNDGVGTNH